MTAGQDENLSRVPEALFRMDYLSWYYIFTGDGIFALNILTNRAVGSNIILYVILVGSFLGLPEIFPRTGAPIIAEISFTLVFLLLLLYPLRNRLAIRREKLKLRRLSTEEIIQSSSNSLPAVSLDNKRKRVLIKWDEITGITLWSNRMRISFGKGLRKKKAIPKFDKVQYLQIQAFLESKLGNKLTKK